MITFFLICTTIVSSAYASSITVKSSLYLSNYNATAFSSDNGSITVGLNVYATREMSNIGATRIVIQEKSGTSWVSVQTYYSSSTPGMLSNNTSGYSSNLTYYGVQGNTYRAIVTVYAGNSSGSSSAVVTTNAVTA